MSIELTRRTFLGRGLAVGGSALELAGAAHAGWPFTPREAAGAPERGTLSIAMLDTHWRVLEPLAKAYGETAGFDLDVTPLDFEALYQQVSLALTQRASTFDIVLLVDSWIPQFASFLSVLEIAPAAEDVIAPVALQVGHFPNDAPVCALPWLGESQCFVSRPDWLERSDRPLPEDWGETIETALHLAAELDSESDLAAFGMRMRNDHERVESFLPILHGYGKSLIDAETSVPQLDTPEALDAMHTYLTLAGLSPMESKSSNAKSNVQRFEEGTVAMMANFWASDLLTVASSVETGEAGPIECTLQPAQAGTARQAMSGIWLAGVPVNSLYPETAFAFLDWLISAELQAELPGLALPPVRTDVLGDEQLNATYPELAAVATMLLQATPRGRSPFYPQLEQLLGAELSKALDGTVTGPDALKNANLALRQFLVREGVLDV